MRQVRTLLERLEGKRGFMNERTPVELAEEIVAEVKAMTWSEARIVAAALIERSTPREIIRKQTLIRAEGSMLVYGHVGSCKCGDQLSKGRYCPNCGVPITWK